MTRRTTAILVVLTSIAQAQDHLVTVSAEGTAAGEGLAARDAALVNAKREAVKQVLEVILAAQDLSPVRPIVKNASE